MPSATSFLMGLFAPREDFRPPGPVLNLPAAQAWKPAPRQFCPRCGAITAPSECPGAPMCWDELLEVYAA